MNNLIKIILNKLICVCFTVFVCLNLNAQTANWQWAKGFGSLGLDQSTNVATDIFGNVYTTGYYTGTIDLDPGAGTFSLTAAGTDDVFISKLDASGNFIWAKSVGGINDDIGTSIAFDSQSNVYLTGAFSGTVDFDPGPATFNLSAAGNQDIFIFKLSQAGDFIWAKAMGGTGPDIGRSIAIDNNGNVYSTGSFSATVDFDPDTSSFTINSAGWDDAYISKLDSSGNFIWAKAMGGADVDYSRSLAIDNLGNIYTIGEFADSADFDPGVGNYNLTATAGATNVFISKLDGSGNFVWAKGMVGLAAANGMSIALDDSDNVYTAGYFMGTIDLDPGTITLNVTSFDAEEDVFISKLDSSGNYQWAKTFGGMGTDAAFSIALDDSANVFSTGAFRSTVDFDPGVGIYNLTPNGIFGIFVTKLDRSGNFILATSAGGTEHDRGNSIAIANSGDVYITGRFSSATISFGTTTLINAGAAGDWDIFIAKLDNLITQIENPQQTNSVDIYPVPASDYFTITLNKISKKAHVSIIDITGKIIYTKTFSEIQKIKVSTEYFASGMYFCVIDIDGNIETNKLIKN